MPDALIVFAKVPRPGEVKTRLTPVLTPAEAAQLYAAFLRDALQQYARLTADVRLYLGPPTPDDGIGAALGGLPEGVTVHTQAGEGLGARMATAFDATFDAGYTRAAVIGTDHPTLPDAFVRQAFASLAPSESVCIGPSEDGGYYLLGMSDFYPVLFEDMTYSHPRVFTDTLARTARTRARLTVLPRWYDVDTPQALRRMLDDLSDARVDAPHTRDAVAALGLESLARTA